MPKSESDKTGVEEIAERLILTRMALGYNQAQIGRLVGITGQAWNNYEKLRKRISIDQALLLCAGTRVTLDWIYRGDMALLPHELVLKIQKIRAEKGPLRVGEKGSSARS